MDASASVRGKKSDGRPVSSKAQPHWGTLEEGTRLGGAYRVIRRIAQGGMGDIYLAAHDWHPGMFAVKVLSPILAGNKDAGERFRQEAAVMAAIRHPNVVQVVDFDSTALGMPYMVMEYLEGRDLWRLMAERALSPAEISRVIREVASGLDAAHRLGIVHRDLKPENIMVVPREGERDLLKIIDFGICKARRFGHVTTAAMLIGTPEFMSPEQARGNHDDLDGRSDQFALGVIGYMLLTRQTPWGTTEPIATLQRVVNHPPFPLRTHLSSACAAVESVLFRAMAKEAGDRYPSTALFSQALDRAMIADGLLRESSIFEPAPPTARAATCQAIGPGSPPKRRRPRRWRKLAWQGAVLLIALASGISLDSLAPTRADASTIRCWDALCDFTATIVAPSTQGAKRRFSQVWKAGVDHLSAVAGN